MMIFCRMAGLPQFLLVIAAVLSKVISYTSHCNLELRGVPCPPNQPKHQGMPGMFRNSSGHLIGGLEMQGRLHPAGILCGMKMIDRPMH